MNAYRSEEAIVQNLRDAGCDEAIIQGFMEELQNGRQGKGLKLLERHRRSLLDALHTVQKRIDCLDYLLFALQRKHEH